MQSSTDVKITFQLLKSATGALILWCTALKPPTWKVLECWVRFFNFHNINRIKMLEMNEYFILWFFDDSDKFAWFLLSSASTVQNIAFVSMIAIYSILFNPFVLRARKKSTFPLSFLKIDIILSVAASSFYKMWSGCDFACFTIKCILPKFQQRNQRANCTYTTACIFYKTESALCI